MDDQVEFTDDEELIDGDKSSPDDEADAEATLTRSEFRVIYQTNNFFLPQVRDIIESGEAINLRPEYQRRLR